MNPFETPYIASDLKKFKKDTNNPAVIEKIIKNFFYHQVIDEINEYNISSLESHQLKIYKINRSLPCGDVAGGNGKRSTIELIQAYCASQAVYLYLLNETVTSMSYPFTRCIDAYESMEMSPYDIFAVTVQTFLDAKLSEGSDYLSEIDQLIIVRP